MNKPQHSIDRTNIKNSLKIVLIISLVLNLAAAFLFARHLYYQSKTKPPVKEASHYEYYRDRLYSELPLSKSDIVFIGDSETQFFPTDELIPGIKNRGIMSDVTKGVFNRLGDVLKWHPKKLFVQVGTNDFHFKTPADTSLSYMDKIITATKDQSTSTVIYIESVLPRKGYSKEVLQYNQSLIALCKKRNVTYIDLYTPTVLDGKLNPTFDVGDGLHLSAAGYKKWCEIIKPYL